MRATLAARSALGGAAAVCVVWLLHRGPIVAPVSLFAAFGSSNGFYSASHIIAAMALVGAAGALWTLIAPGSGFPTALPLAVIGLPLAALAVATTRAVYPHDAVSGLRIAAALSVFWLGLTVAVGTDAGIPLALGLLAGCGDWLAVQGLRQFLAGQPTPVGWSGAFAAEIPVRISASLHNPNVLAAALLLGMGAAGGLAVAARGRAGRAAGAAALVPMALALPLTFSRAAYLALAVLALGTAVLLPRDRRGSAAIALVAVAVPVAVVALRVPGVLFRVHTISAQHGGDLASRLFSWRDALAVWRAHPWVGGGPGGLQALYARYHAVGDAKGTYVLIDVPGSPDSDPLQWLAQTGLVGAAALMAATGVALGWAVRHRGQFGVYAAAGAPLAASVAAVAAQGLLEVTAFVLPIEALLAVTLAALTGIAGQVRPLRLRWLQRGLAAGAAAGGIALALALHAAWAPEAAFERGWAAMAAGHPAAALPSLEAAARLDPTSARNLGAAGDGAVRAAYAALAQGSPAAAGLERTAATDLRASLLLDPFDASVWSAAGFLLGMDGHALAAACAQQAAVRDTPDSPYQAFELEGLLAAAGRVQAAGADAAYAARLFPLQLEVYREYREQGQPYYRQAEQDETLGLQGWTGPLPVRPTYPFGVASCAAAVAAVQMPASAYRHAWSGS